MINLVLLPVEEVFYLLLNSCSGKLINQSRLICQNMPLHTTFICQYSQFLLSQSRAVAKRSTVCSKSVEDGYNPFPFFSFVEMFI